MRCEQVFETLCQTDASPATSPGVREHLMHCAECAQLAATLNPAVALLREAAVEPFVPSAVMAQKGDTPWLNNVAPEALPVIEAVSPTGDKPSSRREAGWPGRDFWQATSLALLIALAFTAFQFRGHDPTLRQVSPANQVKFQPDEAGRHALAAMNLPAGCLGESSQPFFAAPGEAMLQCCTDCHSAAAKQRPEVNLVAVLQNSCQACHISQ